MSHLSLAAALCAACALTACSIDSGTPAGPDQHDSRSVDLDKAERVRAAIEMGSGRLDISGGSPKLLDADFTYNVPSWKPEVAYSSGDLTVKQQGVSTVTGNSKNKWNLRLNNGVPLDLRIQFGAGEAGLDLGSLDLRSFRLEMGAGQLRLDLRGAPKHSYDAQIHGGAGEATIYLPKDAGISAGISGGLGSISTPGLHKDGDRYVNDAYATATVKIRLDVEAGVGSIKVIAE